MSSDLLKLIRNVSNRITSLQTNFSKEKLKEVTDHLEDARKKATGNNPIYSLIKYRLEKVLEFVLIDLYGEMVVLIPLEKAIELTKESRDTLKEGEYIFYLPPDEPVSGKGANFTPDEEIQKIIEETENAFSKEQARITISFLAGYDSAFGKSVSSAYEPTEAELEWERRGYLVGLIESGRLFNLFSALEKKYDEAYMKHFRNAAYMREHNFMLEEVSQNILMNVFGEVRLDVWSAAQKAKKMCGCDE